VLFVDDEELVLVGLSRSARGAYDVSTALGATEALQLMESQTFDVVVSDMRMPGLSGAELLAQVRTRHPRTMRLILSGHADVAAAASAINDGRIFRFLLKPVRKDALLVAIDAALEQKRLEEAEHEVLERTLVGAVDALSETLALANPEAFGRSRRLKRIVTALAKETGLPRRWPLEVAASLSQLGAITLPSETVSRWYAGEALSDVEKAMIARAASVPQQLLRHIPRIEPVISLLDALSTEGVVSSNLHSLEESVLRVAAVVERRLAASEPLDFIISELESDKSIERLVVSALKNVGGLLLGARTQRSLTIHGLQPGMVLVEDVRTRSGALLISRGHEVSEGLLVRLRNFAATIGVREPLYVAQPLEELDATG
jgi:DNA-binding NarL/FixJ family response regulator